MKTFAANEKRSAPAVSRSHHYVHHPMGPTQQGQQAAMRKILMHDEVQAKPDIGVNDGKDHITKRYSCNRIYYSRIIVRFNTTSTRTCGSYMANQKFEGFQPYHACGARKRCQRWYVPPDPIAVRG